ncbi:unnamed protein product [Leptidea sinapis]|uniref:Uncharacterized protein n=1 Tax=Leptidea sinapis TaxID=189913 RepID=A0A5E4PSD9_9NEOP|nr:unnamed protein product [Leptidea sinapis]
MCQINGLELDGCPIEELGLDFILPGDGCTELRRGGRDIPHEPTLVAMIVTGLRQSVVFNFSLCVNITSK